MRRMQRLLEGSKLSIKVVCVVVFVCWEDFMDYVHIIISSNVGFFHLLLPDN